jgi:hypothetical protein
MDRIGSGRGDAAPKSAPLLDPVQLKRKTHGDPSLQIEVLSLFVTEVERLMRQLEEASEPQMRIDRVRALGAVARNTGAALVAQEARTAEAQLAGDNPDLSALRIAVSDTLAYIRRSGHQTSIGGFWLLIGRLDSQPPGSKSGPVFPARKHAEFPPPGELWQG